MSFLSRMLPTRSVAVDENTPGLMHAVLDYDRGAAMTTLGWS